MAHYLVTGAAGFIGSKTAELLLASGHQVTGVDNLNDAYALELKQWRLNRLCREPGFSFVKANISERAQAESCWNGERRFDGVLNLAARAGVRQSVEDPWMYLETNVTGTLNLLELCHLHRVPKFVLSSTSSLYGTHNPLPYREDADTDRPLSPYAASKKAAEALCHSYHHVYGLDVTVLRYFTVYGPAGRPDMSAFRFVQWISEDRTVRIFGDGSQSRDFTYVDDIARGTVAALKPMGYAVINLGSDKPVVLRDFLGTVERLLGKQARIEFQPAHIADVRATWADIGCARNRLGWEPAVGYEEGLENLVAWYLENRNWARSISTQ